LTEAPEYRRALELPDEVLNVIDDYRALRNQIHLPGDIVEAPHIQALEVPIAEFLVGFVNVELVAWSNQLVERHGLPPKMRLEPL
jgi:hypothetical protein